jgi:hypothetical protein
MGSLPRARSDIVARMQSEPRRDAEREIARVDRRWFLTVALVFGASLGGTLGAALIYRATGPHLWFSALYRRAKSYAKRLLRQGLRRP